jgi:uncharacterized protein (TIRG00374 family)
METEEKQIKEAVSKEDQSAAKKKKGYIKYLISVSIVLVLTVASIIIALYSAGDGDVGVGGKQIWDTILAANAWLLVSVVILVFASYAVDGLIILAFCRLYTRRYKFHQGFVNSLIGAFYSAVTPGASGGQVMQVYTMKQQGVEVSNAASIMVMWFILYQTSLIVIDVVAIAVEWNLIMSLTDFTFTFDAFGANFSITLLPLLIIGFALNIGVLFMLFAMSYSHHFHNFIMHYVVNFLAKLHLIKNADKTRENLRVQVENFKIELRRLQSNIPATILILLLFFIVLIMRFSVPYLTALSLNAAVEPSFQAYVHSIFLSAFHQMVVGVFPIPGAAGVSELFFTQIFSGVITPGSVQAVNIIWRTATYHIVVLVSGIVAAFYRSRPKENFRYANRQTFVNIQMETYEMRKIAVDTLYETAQLSKKELQKKLKAKPDEAKRKKKAGDDAS